MPFRATILDDTGRRVPLAPFDLLEWRRNNDRARRLAAASQSPQEAVTKREVLHGLLYGLLAFPILLASALAPAYFAFNLRLPWWGVVLLVTPMGLMPALLTVFVTRRVAAARIARIYRRAGYCASCRYDLTQTRPGPDGRRCCPECGSSWTSA